MSRRVLLLILVILVLVSMTFTGCGGGSFTVDPVDTSLVEATPELIQDNVITADSAEEVIQKRTVITTLFPQYDFARIIAGDLADVVLLLPPGVESHSFEPTPRDVAGIRKADLFIYTGEAMEPWAARVLAGSENEPLLVVDASVGVFSAAVVIADDNDHDHDDDHDDHDHDDDLDDHDHDEDHDDHDHDEDHDDHDHDDDHDDHDHDDDHDDHDDHHDHDHGGVDPHIWLDPVLAQIMVDNIVEGFVQVDPKNEALYRKNGEEYKQKLQVLDAQYAHAMKKTESNLIVYGGHFAFGHLARRYGLKHLSPYSGFAPDAEPTPQRIAELIKTLQNAGLDTIYYEELVDPRVAQVISEQTGAEMVLLHSAHNVTKAEREAGVSYLSIMEENLEKLKKGLRYHE